MYINFENYIDSEGYILKNGGLGGRGVLSPKMQPTQNATSCILGWWKK